MLSARKLEAGSGALKKRKLDEKLVSGILFVLPALALVLVFPKLSANIKCTIFSIL